MGDYTDYFNKIVTAAVNGRLLLMPDQDIATLNAPVGVHDGFPPETELEQNYQFLIAHGNIIAPNTGRPEVFFKAAYPNAYKDFWIASEMGARITSPGGLVVQEHQVPNRDKLISRIEAELTYFPGAFIEREKNCAITIALTDAADRMKAYNHLHRIAQEIARHDGIHIKSGAHPNNTHIELVPHGVDKGSAAEFFVSQTAFKDHLLVCIGDSEPDRDMMVVANDVDGISIGVGNFAPEIAHFSLKDCHAVQGFLTNVVAEVSRQLSLR